MPASFGTGRAPQDPAPPATAAGGRRRDPARRPEPSDPEPAGRSEAQWVELARSVALRQLDAAPRSRAQLEQALARREVPEPVVAAVLDRLTEVGLVDDTAYAEMLVRTRHAERGLARRALAEELHRKGISGEVAETALAQVDAGDEEAAARRLAEKKARATRGLDTQVRRRRMAAMLGRKGFGTAVALRVVEEVLGEEEPQAPED